MSLFSGYGPPRSTALAGSSAKALNEYMVVSTVAFGAPGSVWQKVDVEKNGWVQRSASSDPEWRPQKYGELNSLVKVGSDYHRRKTSGAFGWELVTPTVVTEQPPPTVDGTPAAGDLYTDTRTDAALYQFDDGSWTLIGAGEGGAVDSVNGETGTVVLAAADVGAVASDDVDQIVVLDQADYDLLDPPDPRTLYVIVEESS